ncbi:MAG: peptidase [Myxococcales bacterium]|nr:peptidase [Myxococcales bacterium]
MAAGYPEREIEVDEDGAVVVGGDAVVTLEASREIAGLRRVESELDDGEESFRQYRTHNLVDSGTISIVGYTGGSNALDATMQTALSWAVANYNTLPNVDLQFSLSYGAHTNADIVVYKVPGPGGGQAGFPAGGAPYKWVQIQDGTSAYGTNVVEHVIGHEIGHTIGFRHTDYFNRSLSCGVGGDEGAGSVGANHIPGTPVGTDYDSIMQSCFSASEDGELGTFDIVALEQLYGGGTASCLDACGGFAGACWCDDACSYYGDCCSDKVSMCG